MFEPFVMSPSVVLRVKRMDLQITVTAGKGSIMQKMLENQ